MEAAWRMMGTVHEFQLHAVMSLPPDPLKVNRGLILVSCGLFLRHSGAEMLSGQSAFSPLLM